MMNDYDAVVRGRTAGLTGAIPARLGNALAAATAARRSSGGPAVGGRAGADPLLGLAGASLGARRRRGSVAVSDKKARAAPINAELLYAR